MADHIIRTEQDRQRAIAVIAGLDLEKPRKLAISDEDRTAEQKAVVSWFDLQYPSLKGRLVAIPNGGERNVIVASKLKAEGVRKGFPDLQLLAPRGAHHGLLIEMKRVKGSRVEPEQADWLEWLAQQGYRAEVCRGADQAMTVIMDYLGD